MDLKEFIKESIVQIAQGIEEANKELEKSPSMVNPMHVVANSDSAQAYARTRKPSHDNPGTRIVEKVEFDVAVVAETDKGGKVGAKLSIASIGIGAEGGTKSTNKSESRIKFSIPMVYPGYENKS